MSDSPTAELAAPTARQIVGRRRQALLLALIGVAIFGLTLPATRMAVADFSPTFVMAGRALLAAALAAFTLLWARPTPPRREDWPRLAWFALCSIIGFPLLMNTAMRYAPASHGAVVLAVLPLLTAMAGAAVAGERPSIGFWACGVAGTATVFAYALLSGAGASQVHWADLLLAGAALCASMAYALGGGLGTAGRADRLARDRVRAVGGGACRARLAHAGCEPHMNGLAVRCLGDAALRCHVNANVMARRLMTTPGGDGQ
jgi:drug/metabolite transporter (DMT)-like permease